MKRYRAGVIAILLVALITLSALGCRQVWSEQVTEGNGGGGGGTPTTDIILQIDDAVVAVDGTIELTATYQDTNNTGNPTITRWSSSDTTKATVDSNGKVTGIAPGVVQIEATSAEHKQASTNVTVYTISFNIPDPLTLEDGETVVINPVIQPAGAIDAADIEVTEVPGGTGGVSITQNPDGSINITGDGVGDTAIAVTSPGGGSWEYPIEVLVPSAFEITGEQLIPVSGTAALTATYKDPSHPGTLTITNWESSETAIATLLSATGSGAGGTTNTLQGVAPGVVTVTVTSAEGDVSTLVVTVYKLTFEGGTFPLVLEEGESVTLTPKVEPEGAVDFGDIGVTEVPGGSADITITENPDGSIEITANPGGGGDVTLEVTTPGGGSETFPVAVVPSVITGPDLVDAESTITLQTESLPGRDMSQVVWSSSDPSVATVPATPSATIQVTGVKTGIITITATLGDESWTHQVRVYNAFKTKWRIPSGGSNLILPLSGIYDVIVNWGDGSAHETFSGTAYSASVTPSYPVHNYGSAGDYTVEIYTLSGQALDLSAWGFDGDQPQTLDVAPWIRDVSKWGDAKIGYPEAYRNFTSGRGFFMACENLSGFTATDKPILEGSIAKMFEGCSTFNGDITDWDTSAVTDFSKLFYRAILFNQPIGGWNTTQVTDMNRAFYRAEAFNQNINSWTTDSVTNMSYMFYGASVYDQPLNTWQTGAVEGMAHMFNGAEVFNQEIGMWNTTEVTNMAGMFKNATAFDQPIGEWNTYNVRSTSSMFNGATVFNQDIHKWRMDNNTNMTYMFRDTKNFNKPIDTDKANGYWRVSNVQYMGGAFMGTEAFDQPLNNWNTSNVEAMNVMFAEAGKFNQDLNNWNTTNVEDMDSMFRNATDFNGDITTWETKNVTSMMSMFAYATSFNQDLSGWNVSSVIDSVSFDTGATSWQASNKPTF